MDLLQEINRIDDNDRTSTLANSNQTKRQMVPIKPPNIIETNLQDLPEDCLLEIFACDSLTPMDLLSLSETCKRFIQIAQRVFPKEFGIQAEIFVDSNIYRISWKNNSEFLHDILIHRLLKHFGSNLSTLSIHDSDDNATVVDLVEKNCVNVALQRLEIGYFTEMAPLVKKWKGIFRRVRTLKINDCHFMDDPVSFVLKCDSLVELEIVMSSSCEGVLKQYFPQLRRFAFCNSNVNINSKGDTEKLFQFIARHHLKSLYLESGTSGAFDSDLIHNINDSCTELEELKLDQWETDGISVDVSRLQNLAKLKSLDIGIFYDTWDPFVAFLQELKSLETLTMYYWHPPVFDVLLQLPNFLELHLRVFTNQQIPPTKFIVRSAPPSDLPLHFNN